MLIRLNRETQKLEPALATDWKLIEDGRGIEFTLRPGVTFSDGTSFTAGDVEYTMNRLMAPDLRSLVADQFRSTPGEIKTTVSGPHKIQIVFPGRVSGLASLFDDVSILSAGDPEHRRAVLGPFVRSAGLSRPPGMPVSLLSAPPATSDGWTTSAVEAVARSARRAMRPRSSRLAP